MKVVVPAPAVSALLVLTHIYWGAGYAFGPPRLTASGSYRVALEWATATSWGWAFLVGGALTWVAALLPPWGSAAAHLLAAVPVVVFAVALIAAQALGYSEGWGGIITYLLIAILHGLLVAARLSPGARRG